MNFHHTPTHSKVNLPSPKAFLRTKLKSLTVSNQPIFKLSFDRNQSPKSPVILTTPEENFNFRQTMKSPRSRLGTIVTPRLKIPVSCSDNEKENSGSSISTRTSHNSDTSPKFRITKTPKPSTFQKKIVFSLPPIDNPIKPLNTVYNDDEALKTKTYSHLPDHFYPEDFKKLFKLKLKLPKGTIKSSSEPQMMPLLAKIETGKPEDFKKSSVDIVCVVDKSGSMMGEKLTQLKQGIESLISLMDESDRLSLVTFNTEAVKETPLLCMTHKNKRHILDLVENILAEGEANVGAGMDQALKILKYRRMVNSVTSIFLISDGHDDIGLKNVKTVLKDNEVADSFTIHTFGFGLDHNSKLLSEISDLKGGNFYSIENPKIVDQAFLNCLGELAASIAQDCELTISSQVPRDVQGKIEIVRPMGQSTSWTRGQDSCTVKFNNMVAEKSLNFVLKAKIHPYEIRDDSEDENVFDIFKAVLKFKDLKGNSYEVVNDLWVEMLNEDDELPKIKLDKDVMLQFWRAQVSEVLSKARDCCERFDFKSPVSLLNEIKTELEGSTNREEPLIKGLIKDVENALNDVDRDIFDISGRHNMNTVARAHEKEVYSLQSNVNYSCPMQMKYQNEAGSCPMRKVKSLFLI